MNRKNNVANWIPYLIVMLALVSLFSMNMGTETQTLSYNDLQKVVASDNTDKVTVSISSNITTVSGQYTEDGKTVAFEGTIPSTSDAIESILSKTEKKAVKTTKASRATKKSAADEAEKPVKTTRKRQPKNAE